MPEFDYKAIGRNGFEVSGSEQATSLEALTASLHRQQLALLEASPRKVRAIPFATVFAFVSELSPLLNSGLPLERALQIVGEDSRNAQVGSLAERLRARVEALPPGPDHTPACTVSIGIATVLPTDTEWDTVLTRADQALYLAKAAGRNRVAAV